MPAIIILQHQGVLHKLWNSSKSGAVQTCSFACANRWSLWQGLSSASAEGASSSYPTGTLHTAILFWKKKNNNGGLGVSGGGLPVVFAVKMQHQKGSVTIQFLCVVMITCCLLRDIHLSNHFGMLKQHHIWQLLFIVLVWL